MTPPKDSRIFTMIPVLKMSKVSSKSERTPMLK